MKNAVMEIVQQSFRPEFINRIDDIVVFHPLGATQIHKIVEIQLGLPAQAAVRARHASSRWTSKAARAAGRGRVRPGVRRPAAEARHPAAGGEPAGAGHPEGASSGRATTSG